MKTRLKSFGITLLVSFLVSSIIFGIAALFIVPNILHLLSPFTGDIDKTIEETSNNEQIVAPIESIGSGFSVLLVGTDYQPKVLPDETSHSDSIIFVTINEATKQVIYVPIPSETSVYINGEESTISECYHEEGISSLCKNVSELTGIEVDYYAITSIVYFEKLIDCVDGINYNVPKDMKYEDSSQDLYIDLSKGSQKLNGEDATNMLRYVNDGEENRIQRNVDFIQEILKTFTSEAYKDKSKTYLGYFQDNVTTNFNDEDLVKYLDLIWSYKSLEEVEVTYPGEYKTINDNKVFVANKDDGLKEISKYK